VSATANDAIDVAAAEVSVGAGVWRPVSAVDGAFGGPTEDLGVAATAPAGSGTYDVCVRAQDAAGNVSTPGCSHLTVDGDVPTATIAPPASPTNATSLTYWIDFGEQVVGFTSTHLTRTGTASGC